MPFNAQGQWIPEDDSVATRVNQITAQDSPLMRQAAGMGMRQANRRGMMNSSIGVGAATAAALGAAVPIASQDAQQTYGKNVQHMQGDQNFKLNAANLAAAERERIAAAVTAASGNYSQSIGDTLANDKIPASARAAVQASQRDVLTQQIRLLQNLYGVNLGWSGT